jgi:hypothetical protein
MLPVLAMSIALVRPAVAELDAIPQGATTVEKLSTKKFRHHEVLRIRRDFGMDHWEIALDGWLSQTKRGHIADVRLWWVNTNDADRRKPFSAYLRRYIEFEHRRANEGALAIRMAGDRKEYLFTVELDGKGAPAVFADVRLADGTTVAHCRCDRGQLLARRVLGIPVGIASLQVHCTDDAAKSHDGAVPYRELEHGKPYTPEPG